MAIRALTQFIEDEYLKGNLQIAADSARKLLNKLATIQAPQQYSAFCLFYEGRALADMRKLREGEIVLRNCRDLYSRHHMPLDNNYYMATLALGDCCFGQQKNNEAVALYNEVSHHPDYANNAGLLAKVYHKHAVVAERNRNYTEALRWYDRYLKAYTELHGTRTSVYQEMRKYRDKLQFALHLRETGYQAEDMTPEGYAYRKFPSGDSVVMDLEFARFLVSPLPDPSTDDLIRLIEKAHYLHVKSTDEKITVKLDPIKKYALQHLLHFEPSGELHSMGNPIAELYLLDAERCIDITLSLYPEGYLRAKLHWKYDAKLSAPGPLLARLLELTR